MREALIVWGGWSGHEPEECAHIIRDMLQEDGFKVYVEHSTEAFADPQIKDLSLIVPIMTMSKIEKEEVKNLSAAVEGGVGIAFVLASAVVLGPCQLAAHLEIGGAVGVTHALGGLGHVGEDLGHAVLQLVLDRRRPEQRELLLHFVHDPPMPIPVCVLRPKRCAKGGRLLDVLLRRHFFGVEWIEDFP